MRKKWFLMALSVGLLTTAVFGGAALAWGGSGHGWGWGRGNHDERHSAVASRVAEILGTDGQETADAIAQAREEVREAAADAALDDLAGRVAGTLGTDAEATAAAMKRAAEEMRSEALESRLQAAIDSGRLTEEEAQEYRDNDYIGSYFWRGGKRSGFRGGDAQDYADRVGALLSADGEAVSADDVVAAIEQAMTDIRRERMESSLQAAIDSGKITEEEADDIREKIESGSLKSFGKKSFGKRGWHGDRGRGRGHHGWFGY